MAKNSSWGWPSFSHSSPNAAVHGLCPGCADLQRQLQQAQEKRDEAIERGKEAEFKKQEADDAAGMFQVYKLVAEGLQEKAEKRAEAAERELAEQRALACHCAVEHQHGCSYYHGPRGCCLSPRRGPGGGRPTRLMRPLRPNP